MPREVNEGISPPDTVTENDVSLAPFEKSNKANLQAGESLLAQITVCRDEGTGVPESHYHRNGSERQTPIELKNNVTK